MPPLCLRLNLQIPSFLLFSLFLFFFLFLLFNRYFIFVFGCLLIHHSIIFRMNQAQLQQVYKMVDSVPFSRPKRSIARDFSDGLMMAELIHHYNPKIVELHNYPPANATHSKINNWKTLNSKVLKRLGISLTNKHIEAIANAVPGLIEEVLYQIFLKFEQPEEEGTLANKAKLMQSLELKGGHWQNNQTRNQNSENKAVRGASPEKKRIVLGEGGNETEQIMDLVAKIDTATDKLLQLQQQNKLKDQIIKNLEAKIEKLIFN